MIDKKPTQVDTPNEEELLKQQSNILEQMITKYESIIATKTKITKEPSMQEIVSLYYQVISVSSIIQALLLTQKTSSSSLSQSKQNDCDATSIPLLKSHITKTQTQIIKTFDQKIHPTIITYLTQKIESYKQKLSKTKNTNITTKTDSQDSKSQTILFEELRQAMSTKEFVLQYDKIKKEIIA